MKIAIDKNVVEFKPENTSENQDLSTLWRIIIDCVQDSKSLTPIGEYIPGQSEVARFVIEGVPGGKTTFSEQVSAEEATYICATCNKYSKVGAGDAVPFCCGKIMECVD